MITVMGATASGKTALAVKLAQKLGAEIISADSRQVYRGMNIGTGKDLNEYTIAGVQIPYHLIDIVDAGYRYNVYEYSRDFITAYKSIAVRKKPVILCGGSGLYIEAVSNGYNLLTVPPDEQLRAEMETKSLDELKIILSSMKHLHNSTDTDNRKRAIRAIEIAKYQQNSTVEPLQYPVADNIFFEIRFDREIRRKRITARLKRRLTEGLIEEAKNLMDNGLTLDDMLFYGLEYKYLALYLTGNLAYDEMVEKLNIAIHQFAKRQMTWFRGMERRGANINVIDGELPDDEKLEQICAIIELKSGNFL
ncbi:MAG: tRNA (adenosine(37)-N6)-dimethylallyltransferase MiaA [Prevotellaceae bacterium]|jgi:tRNA dimethylallyltransferase|nr:tRNA (adenosine(37)-N6)-dimethylallyltransferase MiaA [Prevotellaceae bacterium]